MIFSRVAAGILTAFAVCSAAEVPEYFRKGIAGVFPEAKQFREIREKEFAVEDGAGKLLGRLFLESIDDTERRFGYAGTVEVALLFDGKEQVAGVLIGKNVETRRYLNRIRRERGMEVLAEVTAHYGTEEALNRLADHVRSRIDLNAVYARMGLKRGGR